MNKKVALIGKIAVSLILIWILLKKIHPSELISVWKQFSLGLIVTVIVLHFLALLVNVIKWKLFLPDQKFSRLLQFTFIDSFYSAVLPGQFTGEVAKAYRLGKRVGDVSRVASSVFLDKITGIIGLLLVMVVGLVYSSVAFSPWLYGVAGVIIVCGLGSVYAIHFSPVRLFALRIISSIKAMGFLALANILQRVLDAFHSFEKKARVIIANVFLGVLYQFLAIFITVLFAREISIAIPLFDWLWIFGIISIIQFLPISISGLGVREVSFVGILSLFAVAAPLAVALSLSIFALQLFYAILGALVEIHYSASMR